MREASEIAGYHAHVYFDLTQRDAAERLREAISARFDIEMGRLHEKAIGPQAVNRHPWHRSRAVRTCSTSFVTTST